jgi:formylglycine-generating enzyme required for sulfatase activity
MLRPISVLQFLSLFSAALIVLVLGGCGTQVVTRTAPVDGKIMVRVPAGDFKMGTAADRQATLAKQFGFGLDLLASESPEQTVTTSEFYIDQNLVTNAEFKKFLDANPDQPVPFLPDAIAQSFNWDKSMRTYPSNRGDYPAVLVNWQQASAYCKWAGGRLPTEAEWEKAAKGTDGRTWPWGNEWDPTKANTVESGRQDASPVGMFPAGASPYGALDMVGNVWEWTSSLDRPYPYNATDGREDPNAAGDRITRGGSWLFGAAVARAATRNRFPATDASLSIGFRCAE